MPDTLNKQTLINLLIDSPLREPIKINLIDIVNNTSEPDLPKVYSTITKELEIFQKATERRMKLAEETIAKLGGTTPAEPSTPTATTAPDVLTPVTPPVPPAPPAPVIPEPSPMPTPPFTPTAADGLSVPPLDLPPMPTMPAPVAESPVAPVANPAPVAGTTTPAPSFQPLGATPMTASSDEDALAEIQKELDSLKTEAAADVVTAAAPAPAPSTQQ